jgi:hypothetical protein
LPEAARRKIPAPSCAFAASNEISDGPGKAAYSLAIKWRIERSASAVAVKPAPVFLNSKEEIGWKAQLQNSNLWLEVV